MPSSFANLFHTMPGEWKLDRQISSGEQFRGKAVFSELADQSLRLVETGRLDLASGNQVSASRSWIWKLGNEGDLQTFYDEDPIRPYHLVKLAFENGQWIGSADHLCGDDLYEGEYRFSGNSFEIRQVIRGPNKNYELISSYSK